jgi:SAM-dependent methyltransferase
VTRDSFRALAHAAAARYPTRDRTARYFASGKLTRDPAFEYILREKLIPSEGPIVDLGCGQGVLAALLAAAGEDVSRVRGIDLMPRDIERAKSAHTGAEFVVGDIRTTPFGPARCVVILDVLHYIDFAAQEGVLRRVRESLAQGGVLLLRVGDASGSLRFRITARSTATVMAMRGHRLERLWCRPLAEWIALLEKLGFAVRAQPMSRGTPFANVLLVARYDPPAPRESHTK